MNFISIGKGMLAGFVVLSVLQFLSLQGLPWLLNSGFVPAPTLEIDRTRSEADLRDAASRLIQRGFSVTTHLLDGEPVDVITRMVETLGIDLLILGHKRSKKWALRWWRGSVDTLLIERVRCSILLAGEPLAR